MKTNPMLENRNHGTQGGATPHSALRTFQWPLLLVLLSILNPQLSAAPLGTAFTYQGRLNDGGQPADGSYDLRFILYEDAEGTYQVGPILTNAATGVSNGLFTVTLDFGRKAFNGDERWLEIGVRTHGGGAFVPLSPRQPLTPAPYAFYAPNADTAMLAHSVAAGTITSASLAPGAVTAASIASNSISAGQLAPGAALANLNAAGQSGVAGGGIVLSEEDNNPNLTQAGYVMVGRVDLVAESSKSYAPGPPDAGGPSYARQGHRAVWTGSELIVWGGYDGTTTMEPGARYNPVLDTWSPLSVSNAPPCGTHNAVVWTGTEMIVWFGLYRTNTSMEEFLARQTGTDLEEGYSSYGGRYNPATDTWIPMNLTGGPRLVGSYSVVWTGDSMILWGGTSENRLSRDGWRYRPATDTWTTIGFVGAPSQRRNHCGVWTGTEMAVWGGETAASEAQSTTFVPLRDGGLYNPATDTWRPISQTNAPSPRVGATAVWAGGAGMMVWGGWSTEYALRTNVTMVVVTWPVYSFFGYVTNISLVRTASYALNTGGNYNPATDSWTVIPTNGAPSARRRHTAVWSGSEMLVWGGDDATSEMLVWGDSNYPSSGGRYNPATGTWTSIATVSGPTPRRDHTAVWSGSEMLIWGGENQRAPIRYPSMGGRYNPGADTWTPILTPTEPGARESATAIWTGTEMILWGGHSGESRLRSGGRFDPVLNRWSSLSTAGVPSARRHHSAVWTGTDMIVWGGDDGALSGSGGRYNPVADAWGAVTTNGAPLPRQHHTSVWTGSEMLVWGGEGASLFAAGGRYDPGSDTWRPISFTNEPSARSAHTAVWTGSEMIVWGGYSRLRMPFPVPQWITNYNATGGRYLPATDIWMPISTTGAPAPRVWHVAAWTGREMIVWGGTNYDGTLRDGGRYNPTTDTWQALPTNNLVCVAPADQAFWDGFHLLVLTDGWPRARYTPATDTWAAAGSLPSNCSPRSRYAAVWTGSQLLLCGGAYINKPGFSTETYGYTPPRKMALYLKP